MTTLTFVLAAYTVCTLITFRVLFDIRISPLTLIRYSVFWPITVPYLWWQLHKRAVQQDIINSFTKEERELILKRAKELGVKDV